MGIGLWAIVDTMAVCGQSQSIGPADFLPVIPRGASLTMHTAGE